jgi:hypothetical protein
MSFGFGNRVISRRVLMLEQLEERIVLDAAVDQSAQENNDQDQSQTPQDTGGDQTSPAEASGNPESQADQASDPLGVVFNQDLNAVIISNALDDVQGDAKTQDSSESSDVRVLLVSSAIEGASDLEAATQGGVVTILYDGANDSLEGILGQIETALHGQHAESIAFATHDLGTGKFQLTGSTSVSLGTLFNDTELQDFWTDVGGMLTEDGRIDLLACGLAGTEEGTLLLSVMEGYTGHEVAASDDPTGNPAYGGDWILETHGIDLAACYFTADGIAEFTGLLEAYETKLTASDGAEGDYFGYAVSVHGDYAIVGAYHDDDAGEGSDSGSAYIFHRIGHDWVQQAKITASDPSPGGSYYGYSLSDYFGISVSLWGDYAIVGASLKTIDGKVWAGAAYIFHRTGDVWTEQARLTASDPDMRDRFGNHVSISGDYALIGADGDSDDGQSSGSAYIFHRTGVVWTEQTKLTASDASANDAFGSAVSIYGDYAIVGAGLDDDGATDSGSAYIFHRTGDVWTEEAKLTAPDPGFNERFARTVSMYEDYVLIGAYHDNDVCLYSGAAFIFHRTGDVWTQEAKLIPSDPIVESYFGFRVSLWDDYALIGSNFDDDAGYQSGSAYIFHKTDAGWIEDVKLTAADGAAEDIFGRAVSIYEDFAIVGSFGDDDDGDRSGSAYVFDLKPWLRDPEPENGDDSGKPDDNNPPEPTPGIEDDSGKPDDNNPLEPTTGIGDDSGKPYTNNPLDPNTWIGADFGPFSTGGTNPVIDNLLELLSTEGLLPFSFSSGEEGGTGNPPEVAQLGTLLREALFWETQESGNQAWTHLLTFVSEKQAGEGGQEWLGLEDFFVKLKEWQVGKTLEQILLTFNADEIKLIEWFSSLISSGQEALGTEQASALNIEDHVQQSHSSKALVFEMNKMRAADLLLVDIGGPDLADSHEPLGEASRAACTVFDLSAMSFMNLVC